MYEALTRDRHVTLCSVTRVTKPRYLITRIEKVNKRERNDDDNEYSFSKVESRKR